MTRIRIYGHPISGGGEDRPVVEFESPGQKMVWPQDAEIRGDHFHAMVLDPNNHPATQPRNYPYTVICEEFDFGERRGKYISCPFGGRIEMEFLS